MAIYKGKNIIAGYRLPDIKTENIVYADADNSMSGNTYISCLTVGTLKAEYDETSEYEDKNVLMTDGDAMYSVPFEEFVSKISERNSTTMNLDTDSSYIFYQIGDRSFKDLYDNNYLSGFCSLTTDQCQLTFPKNMHVKLYSSDGKSKIAFNQTSDASEWPIIPTAGNPFETDLAAGTTLYMHTSLTSDFKQNSTLYLNYYPILPYIKTQYDGNVKLTNLLLKTLAPDAVIYEDEDSDVAVSDVVDIKVLAAENGNTGRTNSPVALSYSKEISSFGDTGSYCGIRVEITPKIDLRMSYTNYFTESYNRATDAVK